MNDLNLSALIENAACIVLPIEYGGGSNVKTAEALLSDRRIVASPASMRGFDELRYLPGVTVANGPAEFGAAVRSALADGSPAARSPESVASLTWDAMLAPLVALAGELMTGLTGTCPAPVVPPQPEERHLAGSLGHLGAERTRTDTAN